MMCSNRGAGLLRSTRAGPQGFRISALLADTSMDDDAKVAAFRQHLQNGDVRTRIDGRTQKRHQSGPAWRRQVREATQTGDNPKSLLRKDINPAQFVATHAGTGRIAISQAGHAVHEFITFRTPIGRTYNRRTGKYEPAYVMQIKYTDNGVHIFPTKPPGNQGSRRR